jgi:hypothetical protein
VQETRVFHQWQQCFLLPKTLVSVMATLVTKLSFVTRVAISGVWLTSHTGFCIKPIPEEQNNGD